MPDDHFSFLPASLHDTLPSTLLLKFPGNIRYGHLFRTYLLSPFQLWGKRLLPDTDVGLGQVTCSGQWNLSRCNWSKGFPDGSVGKESACNAGNERYLGSIPGPGRSHGVRSGNPLQYSSLKIPWTEEPSRLQSMGAQRVRHD